MRNLLPLAVLVSFLFQPPAGAQLSGMYTVGPAGTYQTLAAAAQALAAGVTGPVTFVVTGAHAGPITVPSFPGQGPANPVLFFGGGAASLTGTGTVLTLNGCQDVTFDGFGATFSTGTSIVISGSNNVFKNCVFTQPVTTSGTANKIFSITSGTGITIEDCQFGGGYEAFNSAAPCDQLTFQRNRIEGGGFWIAQILGTNVTVKNNFFYGSSQYGLRAGAGTTNLRILNNSFYIAQATGSSQFCTLRWYSAVQGEVINNAFHDVQVPSNGNILWCSGSLRPTVMDHNVFHLVNGLGLFSVSNVQTTLATWQSTYGLDLNSIEADPGFVSPAVTPPDLHVTPSSPCFLAGQPNPNVLDDIDLQPRNPSLPTIGADELPATGLFAGFTAAPLSGAAPLTVSFTDTSFSSAPGGVTSWAWDFQNDGIDDAFVANPNFTYACPGMYSVKLTVNDGTHPQAMIVQSNLINVAAQPLVMTTTGGGTGDLAITPVPASCYPTAVQGWTLISLSTTMGPSGTGPFLGIFPDFLTVQAILFPAAPGNPLHFIVTPATYPNGGPLNLPPGTFSGLAGISMDAVEVLLDAAFGIVHVSNVVRVTF